MYMLLIKQRGNLLVRTPAVTCLRDSLIQNFLFLWLFNGDKGNFGISWAWILPGRGLIQFSLWNPFKNKEENKVHIAWVNSWYFAVHHQFPRNDLWETMWEIPHWQLITNQICFWLVNHKENLLLPIRSTYYHELGMGISVHAHSRANQWWHHKMLAVFSGYAHNNLLHAQVNLHAIINWF